MRFNGRGEVSLREEGPHGKDDRYRRGSLLWSCVGAPGGLVYSYFSGLWPQLSSSSSS
jgi:hypothetical protein